MVLLNKLLEIISTNADLTTAQLAAMLNEKEENIISQLKDFEKEGILKGSKAIINWDKAPDKNVTAIIELTVTPKKETGFDEIAKTIMKFHEVESIYLMAGTYDFSIMVRGSSIQEISMFVSKKLSTLDSVMSTATHFVLTRYKDSGIILCDEENKDERSNMLL